MNCFIERTVGFETFLTYSSVPNKSAGWNIYQKLINKLISKKNNGVVALNFWGLKDRNGRQKLNKNILSIYDRNLNPNPCLETIKSCLNNGE